MPHHKSTSENIVVMHSLFSWSKPLPVYFYILLLCGLAAANVSIYQTISAPQELQVTVLEVGKGNATIVRAPSGKTILIDTGSDASILRALGSTLPEWQRSLDVVILTSENASFAGALPIVESRYHISNRTSIGDQVSPYGTSFIFDKKISITIIAPGIFSISDGTASILISSTTPQKTYVLK